MAVPVVLFDVYNLRQADIPGIAGGDIVDVEDTRDALAAKPAGEAHAEAVDVDRVVVQTGESFLEHIVDEPEAVEDVARVGGGIHLNTKDGAMPEHGWCTGDSETGPFFRRTNNGVEVRLYRPANRGRFRGHRRHRAIRQIGAFEVPQSQECLKVRPVTFWK